MSSPYEWINATNQEAFVNAVIIKGTCKSTGYKTNGSFFMKPLSVRIIFSTVGKAERLITMSSITLECNTPMQLSASPFRQINILWAFELIIEGVAAFNMTFLSYLDKWFTSRYQNVSNSSLLHSACIVEENYHCETNSGWFSLF